MTGLVEQLLTDISNGADAIQSLEGRRLTTRQLSQLVSYVAKFLDAAGRLGVDTGRKP